MKIIDLINRSTSPLPWHEGENIPWDELGFSERMLREHLCQDHDAASRRFEKIEEHIDWIHRHVLSERPTRILDLCCGPGFYTSRLARLGHECVGIDYAPASIRYAMQQAEKESLPCQYMLEDIRTAAYGANFGLIMLIFGEFNVFRPKAARQILKKMLAAMDRNSLLMLEVHTLKAIRNKGREGATWCSIEKGLFSDRPHLLLQESFWDPGDKATTKRYYTIDAVSGMVKRYAQSLQAYTNLQYRSLLKSCGFADVRFLPSLTGVEDTSQPDFVVIVARKEAIR
jgi:SAM-dependent methyltransferase